jgi:phosphoglycolate phosphatase
MPGYRVIQTVFFDLDGTLTHSHDGIVRCINHALMVAGAGARSPNELRPFVGPPLRESFATLLETTDEPRVEQAMVAYRRRFEAIGMFESSVCPGIPEALEELAIGGLDLHVVTAKPTVYARQILDHVALGRFFTGVYGPELTSREYSKASLIRAALQAIGCDPAVTAMIGDRGEDIIGARSNGVSAIAVTWGYGDVAELEAAFPDAIARSPAELKGHLKHCSGRKS